MSVTPSRRYFMDRFIAVQTSMDCKFTFKSRLCNTTIVFWGLKK
jgi:hypothetical protein